MKDNNLKNHIKLFRYDIRDENRAANSLIYALKSSNRKDVVEFLTAELSLSVSASVENISECIFTNVPRRKGAVIKFGYDQSELLAKSLAKRFGAEYKPLLASLSKKSQKQLRKRERLSNADFMLISSEPLGKKTVIIVDDIVTTGASVVSAAKLIRKLGRVRIVAASVAYAYKDEPDGYVIF